MTIFHEPWWLDIAAAHEGWDEVRIVEAGLVVGRLPFVARRRLGRCFLGMPPLTRLLGPWVRPGDGHSHAERQRQARIVSELISGLPRHDLFKQFLSPDIGNALPFQFAGFALSCEHFFVIDCRHDPETLWNALPSKTRTLIRRARKLHRSEEVTDPDLLNAVYDRNIRASGRVNTLSDRTLIGRLHEACRARDCGRVLALRDAAGQLAAAVFVVWWGSRMHFLLQTRNPAAGNGVIEALVWEACLLAHARGLVFDLDGVNNEVAARRMVQLGGEVGQRVQVMRGSLLLPSLHNLRRELRWRLGNRSAFV